MGIPRIETVIVTGAYGTADDVTFTGTFHWCLSKSNNTIIRLRPSDNAYLDASGAVTNLAGATVALTGYAPWLMEYMAGSLWIVDVNSTLRVHDAVTGAFQTSFVSVLSGMAGCVHQGLFWMGASDAGKHWVRGFNAGGQQASIEVGYPPWKIVPNGDLMYYVSTQNNGNVSVVGVVDLVGGVEIAPIPLINSANQITALEFDGTYLWAGGNALADPWRVRASDGAVILPDGSTGTFGQTVPLRQAYPHGISGGSYRMAGGFLWIAGWGTSELVCIDPITQRTVLHYFAPNDQIAGQFLQYWTYFASWRLKFDGTYLYIPMISGDPQAGYLYRVRAVDAACPPTEVLTGGAARDANCGVVAPPIPCAIRAWPNPLYYIYEPVTLSDAYDSVLVRP